MLFSPDQLNNLPQLPGIYKFYSATDELLYVGKAKNLKKRISSYFDSTSKEPKISLMTSRIDFIGIIPVSSEFEALLLEARLINENQPKYNVLGKDNKHYIYIQITKEEFPKILFARKETLNGSYFGPFPSTTIVKELLRFLRTIFPYCTQKSNNKRGCFYTHLGLCNPCPAHIKKTSGENYQILKKQYKHNIGEIIRILEGKIGNVRQLLTKQMLLYSKIKEFEKAAVRRDKIVALDYLVNQQNRVDSYISDPGYLEKIVKKEQEELIFKLQQYFPKLYKLESIECYDTSNISGKLATGSMVTFVNGRPDKNLYRKFRIKFVHKPNDFEMLKEILTRRLKHEEWKLPDMIIIDGGRPQLMALQKGLSNFQLKIPMIGLAKRYEEIVVPVAANFIKLRLTENSPALHLVKRMRDEAHRFAHKYHSLLRLKQLLPDVSS